MNREDDELMAILWQRWVRQSYDTARERLADGNISQAIWWQETAAWDYVRMWEYLQRLV